MNYVTLVKNSIAQAVRLAGDVLVDVRVAGAIDLDPQPGENYEPTWKVFDGSGFFETVAVEDYPSTVIQTEDRTLVVLQCPYDVQLHDFVLVGDRSYHVYGVKPELIGVTRILQKLLVRPERKDGIAWESSDPTVA